MKLLDQIIEEAADDNRTLGGVLRKCLTLAYSLQNQKLQNWLLKELNGYEKDDELPKYRLINSAVSKGFFLGGFGSSIADQPLALSVLSPEHRKMVKEVDLRDPLAAYHVTLDKAVTGGTFMIHWPPDLTLFYQSKFIEGYALNRAYIEIPVSVLIGLSETVRTRVLQFALEIRQELGDTETDHVEGIPSEKVASIVNNYIYGGQNVVGSTTGDIKQIGTITVAKDDLASLNSAMRTAGIGAEDLSDLKSALKTDQTAGGSGIGEAASSWLQKVASGAVKVGGGVSTEIIAGWIAQYLGIR